MSEASDERVRDLDALGFPRNDEQTLENSSERPLPENDRRKSKNVATVRVRS
jgi:hypothetical protein